MPGVAEDDINVLDSERMIVNNLENTTAAEPQIVQNYGIDSLVTVSSNISSVREFRFRQVADRRAVYKQTKQYPAVGESITGSGVLTEAVMVRFCGKRTAAVLKLLQDRSFCRKTDTGEWVLTWRFRNLAEEDFDIKAGKKTNRKIYRSLEALLWTDMPQGASVDQFLEDLKNTGPVSPGSAHQISDLEYWYRQGLGIVAILFSAPPSPELLSLLDLKLQLIQQEKMQNYFHIISSFNMDSSSWMNEKNRSERFYKILEDMLTFAWRPFDMKSCEVSINAGGEESAVIAGTMRLDFSEDGTPHSQFDRLEKNFSKSGSQSFEFIVNDVAFRTAENPRDMAFISLHLVSRSAGNVDPRRNILTHRFVRLFIESVAKLVDVVMPVIHREEAEQSLRWRYFLDSMRLKALENGENLHLILTDALVVLRKFFGIFDVSIYSEDKDLARMLSLFSRSDPSVKLYGQIKSPFSPADLLNRQLVLIRLRDIPEGRVLLYFEIPRRGKRPMNPESPEQYLMGTDIWSVVNEEAILMGIPSLKDILFFVITECMASNPKAALANFSRRLPVRGGMENQEQLIRLFRRIMVRFSLFFDLFQTLSGNLESGLAYMRGRRDNLTGLYNRQHFKVLLNELFHKAEKNLGLIFLDMDNFKIFNDTVSHDFGDKLLSALANRMIGSAESQGSGAVPGRFGGDEFCYFVSGLDSGAFETKSVEVFRNLTELPLMVSFYFDDRVESDALEINMISFLHRLMRPDVGSRQASRMEFIEKSHISPRGHVLDVWKHYRGKEHMKAGGGNVQFGRIVDDIVAAIEDKILYNKIFPEVDTEFRKIIRLFVSLQLRNYTTNRIREYLIREIDSLSVNRNITLKLSAGLAHSSENRLRSTDSLFKAADNRAAMAKLKGRNCMYGINGQRLI